VFAFRNNSAFWTDRSFVGPPGHQRVELNLGFVGGRKESRRPLAAVAAYPRVKWNATFPAADPLERLS
jgi:hypothetical protein